jgi:hypothetical protein
MSKLTQFFHERSISSQFEPNLLTDLDESSVDEGRSKISFNKGLPSIKLDNLSYRHDGKRACCLGCAGLEFPRRLISVSGFVVYVVYIEEISQHRQALGGDDVLRTICIRSSVERLCEHCFSGCNSLSTVAFKSDSKVSCLEGYAFVNCSSLSTLFLPSSVETICAYCFNGCHSHSTIRLLSKLQQLGTLALSAPNLRDISIEDVNCNFKVNGSFIFDFEGHSITRSFGNACEVEIGQDIQILSGGCFAECVNVSRVKFAYNSQLLCIENLII